MGVRKRFVQGGVLGISFQHAGGQSSFPEREKGSFDSDLRFAFAVFCVIHILFLL